MSYSSVWSIGPQLCPQARTTLSTTSCLHQQHWSPGLPQSSVPSCFLGVPCEGGSVDFPVPLSEKCRTGALVETGVRVCLNPNQTLPLQSIFQRVLIDVEKRQYSDPLIFFFCRVWIVSIWIGFLFFSSYPLVIQLNNPNIKPFNFYHSLNICSNTHWSVNNILWCSILLGNFLLH